MNISKPSGGSRVSDICEDSIMQAGFIVKEKIANRPLQSEDSNIFIDKPSNEKDNFARKMYFRVEQPNDGFDAHGKVKEPKQNQDLTLRFLSYLNPSKSLLEKYRIFYTTNANVLSELSEENYQ